MNLLRSTLNQDGYLAYRWLRLLWSRRRRRKRAERLTRSVVASTPAPAAKAVAIGLADQLRKLGAEVVSPKYRCNVIDVGRAENSSFGIYDFELSVYDPARDCAVRSTLPWTIRDGVPLLEAAKMKWLNAAAKLDEPQNVFVAELERMTRPTNRRPLSRSDLEAVANTYGQQYLVPPELDASARLELLGRDSNRLPGGDNRARISDFAGMIAPRRK